MMHFQVKNKFLFSLKTREDEATLPTPSACKVVVPTAH